MREEVIGSARLILGDCRDVLPGLTGVGTVVTSPPYWHQRDYGREIGDWTELVSTLAECRGNPQILVNLGLIYRDGELVEYWDGFKGVMRSKGWRLFGWYVWDKGFGMPAGDQANRPMNAHEWVFHFNRSSKPINKWVRSKDRTTPGDGIRQTDGTIKKVTSLAKVGQPYKAPDSVIRIPPHQLRGGVENEHPAIFPVELPSHLLQTFSQAGEVILDPFLGSGTTGVACARLGHSFVGIEIEPRYFDIACRRIEQAQRQADLFVNRVTPDTQPYQPPSDLFAVAAE